MHLKADFSTARLTDTHNVHGFHPVSLKIKSIMTHAHIKDKKTHNKQDSYTNTG